jgi:hypothetical protein
MTMLFHRFDKYLEDIERHDERISSWSVGMHIDHLIRAGLGIADAIEKSEPRPRWPRENPCASVLTRRVSFIFTAQAT